MPKPNPPATSLPIDPALPVAIPLPWPGQWAGVVAWYDVYKCESFMDHESEIMQAVWDERRRLDARAREIAALPDPAARAAAEREWTPASRAQRRTDALTQIAYFVQRIEYPGGQTADPTQAETFAAWPLRMLEWLADTGWTQARDEVWSPKSPTPSIAAPASER